MDLIERTFHREGSLYITCDDRNAFFTSDAVRNIIYGLVRKCVKLSPFSKIGWLVVLGLAALWLVGWLFWA